MSDTIADPVQVIIGNCGEHRIREKIFRLNFLSRFYIGLFLTLSALSIVLGVCYLSHDQPRVGIPLLIAAAAFFTYGFNTQLQHQLRVGEHTSGVLGMLRGRWDELRTDETLAQIFSGEKETLTNQESTKLRYFLYTLFDVYEYAMHLIYNGYFTYPEALGAQYRNMIKKLLLSPHVVSIWESNDETGELVFQNEYSQHLRQVVNLVLEQLRTDGTLPRNSLDHRGSGQ